MQKNEGKKGAFSTVATIAVFLAMLGIIALATIRLSASSDEQGLEALHDAIQRSAVLCYATEGYYPPSLAYIEENYGVQIDSSRFVVRYDVLASNLMPEIYVWSK